MESTDLICMALQVAAERGHVYETLVVRTAWGAACMVDDRNAAELICMVAFPHVQSLSQRTGSLLAILSGCPEFSRPISWHFPTRGGMRGSWCLFLFLTNCLLIAFNKTQAGPISSSFFAPRRRWEFCDFSAENSRNYSDFSGNRRGVISVRRGVAS